MTIILCQRGATAWGFQIGRWYMCWPYLRFLRVGVWPTIAKEDLG